MWEGWQLGLLVILLVSTGCALELWAHYRFAPNLDTDMEEG